jgi:hypothetical protein
LNWAFTAVFAVAAPLFLLAEPALVANEPEVWTDKPGYLAGAPVRISGEGFSPLELVTLRVIHEDGTAEAGAGHEAFSVRTSSQGTFHADWSIAVEESAGLSFIVIADAPSGTSARAAFIRVGEITGGLKPQGIRIRAQGFNPNEPVTLTLNDGHDHSALTTFSDESGALTADLDLPAHEPEAATYVVTASASRSGLTLSLPITDYIIVNQKPNGIPALAELRSQNGLERIGYRDGDNYFDFFVAWNAGANSATGPGNGRSNACALFDTTHDNRIDFAICGQAAPSVWACDNERIDRCGGRSTYRSQKQVQSYVEVSASADSAPHFRVQKSFLPPDAELVRVCSYAFDSASADDGPNDCIALPDDDPVVVASAAVGPALTGRVVYHSYASYNDGTSQLFLMNLATSQLTNLSAGWTNLTDPMNAHWSPDGTRIVFMARPKKGGKYTAWFDIFLYVVGQRGNPVNLTNTNTKHDEDPKFSPDGSRIVHKVRPSTLREIDLKGNLLRTIVSSSGQERSMPYHTSNAGAVWYSSLPSGLGGSASSIRVINVNGTGDAVVVDTPSVIDFYPIRDTVGQFLYSRTVSATNLYGQVYVFDGAGSVSLPFNTNDADYNDAYPLGAQYIVVSSTRAGGRGGYDLYVADRNTGAMWSMSGYNSGVNTSREELGAAYTPN